MKTATLRKTPGGEKMRFEVQSAPSRGNRSSGVQKWYLKANHPVEASRWMQAIGKSIELYKREGTDSDSKRNSGESQFNFVRTHSQASHRGSVSTLARKRHDSVVVGNESGTSFVDTGDEEETGIIQDGPPDHGAEEEDVERNDSSSAVESIGRVPPYDASFDLHGNSTTAQMELTSQLLSNLALPPSASPRAQELKSALKDSFSMVQDMMNEYICMAKERDEWWRLKVQREQERQTVWEESLRTVVKEGEVLERELRTRSRKRGSRFFDARVSEGGGTLRQWSALSPVMQSPLPEEIRNGDHFAAAVSIPKPAAQVDSLPEERVVTSTILASSPQSRRRLSMPSSPIRDNASLDDTDEEDEFYDAIESNNLPNLDVHEFLASPFHSEQAMPLTMLEPYAGYKQLRDRLPIGSDNRPTTSLWSVLKHSIGKDLTKISFPVFFNEPTSMLQRMVS